MVVGSSRADPRRRAGWLDRHPGRSVGCIATEPLVEFSSRTGGGDFVRSFPREQDRRRDSEGPEAAARRARAARDQFRQLGRKAVQLDIAGASVAFQKILFRSGKSCAAGRRAVDGSIEQGQRIRGPDHGFPGWRAHCRRRAFRHHPHAGPARHKAKHPRAVRPQNSKPFRHPAFGFLRFLDHGFIQPSSLKIFLAFMICRGGFQSDWSGSTRH